MSADLAHAEYYPYHGDLGRIPWMPTTDEDEKYLNERIHNIEQRKIYSDYERKRVDWKATYRWIEEGMRDIRQPSPPYMGYALDTTVPHHPHIRKVKKAQHAMRPAASQEKAKGGNGWRRRKYFTFGKSKSNGM